MTITAAITNSDWAGPAVFRDRRRNSAPKPNSMAILRGAVAGFALAAAPLAAAQTSRPEQAQPGERRLASIWREHIGNPGDHARIVHLCGLFRAKAPDDPLLAVTDGLTAWHMLKLGRTNEAVSVMEKMIAAPEDGSHLRSAAVDMARAWLTRVDREATVRALRRMYLKDVEYPGSLDGLAALPEDGRPPLEDRWGKRWSYHLVGFKYIRGAGGQRYELRSVVLGANSDLAEALAKSYACGIRLVPERYGHDGKGPAVVFRVPPGDTAETGAGPGGTVRLAPGRSADGVQLAYLGRSIMILADHDHWLVLPRPARGQRDTEKDGG